jgi:hypothetical protein
VTTSGEDGGFERKFDKLKPWLVKANQNVTHNQKIINELNRVKTVNINQEKFSVNRGNLITEE